MTWAEASKLVLAGKRVRRLAWKGGCSIVKGDPFFKLEGNYGNKNWTPYVVDFEVKDWVEA